MRRFLLAVLLVGAALAPLQARPIGQKTAVPVVIDTGDTAGGFNVTVGTTTTVLLSSSSINASMIWRVRTFQVTNSSYNVWMTTYTPAVFNSGAGWFVFGSTGSYTTRSQAAYYGILDPSAGAATAAIHGPYEFHKGEVPVQ